MQDWACLGLLCLDMNIVRKVCLEFVGCGRWVQDWACLGLLCLDINIVRKVCLEFVGCGRWMQDWACLGLLCLDMHVVRKVCLEAVGYRTWMDQVIPRGCQRWARRVSSTASHDTCWCGVRRPKFFVACKQPTLKVLVRRRAGSTCVCGGRVRCQQKPHRVYH